MTPRAYGGAVEHFRLSGVRSLGLLVNLGQLRDYTIEIEFVNGPERSTPISFSFCDSNSWGNPVAMKAVVKAATGSLLVKKKQLIPQTDEAEVRDVLFANVIHSVLKGMFHVETRPIRSVQALRPPKRSHSRR